MTERTVKLPTPRFTMRGMMIAVAILAVVLALGVGIQRRKAHYLHLAAYHREQAMACLSEAQKGVICLLEMGDPGPIRVHREDQERSTVESYTEARGPEAGLALKRGFEHRLLMESYEECATRPWLDVAPVIARKKREKP
jgi:hypothetical protein